MHTPEKRKTSSYRSVLNNNIVILLDIHWMSAFQWSVALRECCILVMRILAMLLLVRTIASEPWLATLRMDVQHVWSDSQQ